jgi:acetyl esterase
VCGVGDVEPVRVWRQREAKRETVDREAMEQDGEDGHDAPPIAQTRAAGKLLLTITAIVGIPSAMVLALAIGTLLPAESSLYAFTATSAWTTYGPHLVVVAVITTALGVVVFLRRRRLLPAVVGLMGVAALVWSLVICGTFVVAARTHGGHVDPLAAFALGSMDAESDRSEVFASPDGQDLTATIYAPPSGGAPAPVMMYVHGGGWINGASTDLGHDRRWFADRGWLVVSVEYRLATEHHATWDEAPRDVACAAAWVTANAARLGADADRLVVAGDSAGGNLAVNLAYSAAQGQADSSCAGEVPIPDAVVAQYPVVDPSSAYEDGYPIPGFEPRFFTERYLGGTPEKYPDRLAAISSSSYLSAGAPPTLIIEPASDGLIPSAGVLRWVGLARNAGVDITLADLPFANHAYNLQNSSSLGNQAALTIIDAYLRRIGIAPTT